MSSTTKSYPTAQSLSFPATHRSNREPWNKKRWNPATSFSGVLEVLLLEFAERFQDFDKSSENMRLVASPHLVSAPLDVQLIELKNNAQLIKKFEDKNDLLETWKIAVEYPKLHEIARNTVVLFGSTYMCKASFSQRKYLKNYLSLSPASARTLRESRQTSKS